MKLCLPLFSPVIIVSPSLFLPWETVPKVQHKYLGGSMAPYTADVFGPNSII